MCRPVKSRARLTPWRLLLRAAVDLHRVPAGKLHLTRRCPAHLANIAGAADMDIHLPPCLTSLRVENRQLGRTPHDFTRNLHPVRIPYDHVTSGIAGSMQPEIVGFRNAEGELVVVTSPLPHEYLPSIHVHHSAASAGSVLTSCHAGLPQLAVC